MSRFPKYHFQQTERDALARTFGHAWLRLSQDEQECVQRDFEDLSADEFHGDADAAAIEYRRRIGGRAHLKSYARTMQVRYTKEGYML
jgi:hypothetical protein